MKSRLLFWAFCLLFCNSFHFVKPAAVMSVDFGSEWMKVGVVSPGVPMEIALNKESKRKTPAVIAFRDGERTFGEDAFTIGVRFPKNSYAYLLDLLGKTVDHPLVQQYMKTFPYYKIEADPERSTPVFIQDDDTKFSPEELVAQLLNKAREFAQISTGQPIKDCVITVPGFFNFAERMAMLEAAKLADLKVLQLINDHTAVALNYGIFRIKEMNDSSQYVIFYDMGARSTKVSVVEYKIIKTKERGFVESHPQLQVLGVGYDRTLGGLEITLRLRDHLAKAFNQMKKTPNDVTKNPRAMAKLLKEANRVKVVLSANADHYAQVEGLLDDQDFRVQVTREELESMCSDLYERIPDPLNAALKSASLTMDVISQVILVGASTRVPKVQEILTKTVGSELGKSINTDEAATMGAVYRAADLSIGFKVKKFITKDAVLFPIQVIFEREHDGHVKHVKRTLFGLMNPYPQKKVITFNKHTDDFSFFVNYAELEHLNANELKYLGSLNLSKVDLNEVAETLSKHQGPNIESKGIKAHFAMDDSGLIRMVNIELVAEKTLSSEELEEEESSFAKLGNTISKFFGSDSGSKETVKVEKEKESQEKPEGTEDTVEKPVEKNTTEKAAAKNDTESAEKVAKPKIIIIKEPIKAQERLLSVSTLNEEQYKASVNKLEDLDKKDEEKRKRETALNNLESFVIDTQSKLESDEYKKCGTKEEVEKIIEKCLEASQWLYDDGAEAGYKEYDDKLKKLQKLSKNVFARHWEHQERPEAVSTLESLLNRSSVFLKDIQNFTKESNPEKDIFTEVEINVLSTKINDIQKWKADMVEQQNKLKPHEEVVLTVGLLADKMRELDREVNYLISKMKIWKPKKPSTTPKPEKAANETASGDGEAPVIEPPVESSGSGSSSDTNEENQVPKESEDKTTEGFKTTMEKEEEVAGSADEHLEL